MFNNKDHYTEYIEYAGLREESREKYYIKECKELLKEFR